MVKDDLYGRQHHENEPIKQSKQSEEAGIQENETYGMSQAFTLPHVHDRCQTETSEDAPQGEVPASLLSPDAHKCHVAVST